MFNAGDTVTVFLFNVATIIMIVIWLSGFDNVHWFSYVTASFFSVVAAATGFCLGLLVPKRVLVVLAIKK